MNNVVVPGSGVDANGEGEKVKSEDTAPKGKSRKRKAPDVKKETVGKASKKAKGTQLVVEVDEGVIKDEGKDEEA